MTPAAKKNICELPLLAAHERHDASFPHSVLRPQGTNLWVLEYAISGKGFLVTPAGAEQAILPRTFLLFAPGTFQHYGMDPALCCWEHCFATFTPRAHWHSFFSWPEVYRGLGRIEAGPEAAAKLETAFTAVIHDFSGRTLRREDYFLNRLENLLLELDAVNPLSNAGRLDARVRTAMDYIRRNFRRDIALEELAAAVCLSPSRFSHLFAAETGCTPIKYLEQQRLENARGMLAMTRATVEDIAAQNGFHNPFYFSRAFKRAFAVSPRAYRQSAH